MFKELFNCLTLGAKKSWFFIPVLIFVSLIGTNGAHAGVDEFPFYEEINWNRYEVFDVQYLCNSKDEIEIMGSIVESENSINAEYARAKKILPACFWANKYNQKRLPVVLYAPTESAFLDADWNNTLMRAWRVIFSDAHNNYATRIYWALVPDLDSDRKTVKIEVPQES